MKPILALTLTTSEIRKGNLNVTAIKTKGHGNDELSAIIKSFNFMLNSLRTYVKKQNKLTELERANEELKYKDKVKDEFINVAAHEIKNPIQSILAFSELLRKRGKNIEEKDNEFLDVIIKNSKRLIHFAEEVLDTARIESGSFSLNKEKFNLKELITDILKEYEQIIQNKKNFKLIYESPEMNEIIIEADRNRLCQVIRNLLNNAIHFTNEGSIAVVVEERKKNDINGKGDEILVSIKNTRTGIHPEILPVHN